MTPLLRRWALPLLAATIGMNAAAADYPTRPITLVIGFTAGGPTDAVGRYLARQLETELGQTVVVENRAGANGVVAVQAVRRAPADGYTLMLGSSGTLSIEPVYKQKVDYQVLKDFQPIALVASYPYLLVVPTGSPFDSVQALIAGAREKPGALTFASAGSGAVNHLAGEWFKSATQVDITHVPYKGDSAAIADLVAGRVDMAFLSAIAAMPQVQAGKLRALGIAAAQPSSVAPGVPTVAQAAGIPGFTAEPWNGVLAPAGVPPAVKQRLNAAINKVMGTDEARDALLKLGQYPMRGTPDDFARHIGSQTERWAQVMQTSHIAKAD
ncbi:tripartite tricarboxylate transporter substrate binding protein [Achromobacter sp. MFA1 R4]|uniref:Bug family tripartite tricarboxylate transporter substrate binding protein n=1 Tax=Achromobacter sp. MFA1 R4 TaxID=1881016 RepID=UPI0009538911|nr:tripartite tricarboxylate transporter substrate binding protein [Achromobacter sp. MFA1 R4]SIT30434.1 Tripartite-type tricarboxylate transporter, receptor component TctC [Achromobacter sp. MFA1 R4]